MHRSIPAFLLLACPKAPTPQQVMETHTELIMRVPDTAPVRLELGMPLDNDGAFEAVGVGLGRQLWTSSTVGFEHEHEPVEAVLGVVDGRLHMFCWHPPGERSSVCRYSGVPKPTAPWVVTPDTRSLWSADVDAWERGAAGWTWHAHVGWRPAQELRVEAQEIVHRIVPPEGMPPLELKAIEAPWYGSGRVAWTVHDASGTELARTEAEVGGNEISSPVPVWTRHTLAATVAGPIEIRLASISGEASVGASSPMPIRFTGSLDPRIIPFTRVIFESP